MKVEHINKAFGKVIKQARVAQGLSQQELADYAELDRSYISDMERGRYNPTVFTVYKLADIFKISPHEIIKEADKILKV